MLCFVKKKKTSFLLNKPDKSGRGHLIIHIALERFSFECRKTKTKVITLTNHNSRKQSNEPTRARSKYMSPVPSAEKRAQASRDWFWFYL